MGYATAAGYAEMVGEGGINLSTAIEAHFASNMYPPVPAMMVPVAVAAIEAVQGDPEEGYAERIDLPEGVQFRDGELPTAADVIDNFRLDAFV